MYFILKMSRSRYIEIRPDNLDSTGEISFKNGFPQFSFTIQSQDAILDPSSIRLNGDLQIYTDNASPPTPAKGGDAHPLSMDNRLGIYSVMEQLTIRHNRSKQVVENIKNYNKMMSSYVGAVHSMEDLMGHSQEVALINPNPEAMQDQVVHSAAGAAAGAARRNSFSAHLPSGFLMSGNSINLMESSFGAVQVEINLAPDSNVLFSRDGTVDATNSQAHYVLSNLSLTAEVVVPDDSQIASLRAQTTGAMSFNSINSLYTTINTSNAQLQFNLGMKQLQSVFMTFTPSNHINTLAQNGMATTYMSQSTGNKDITSFSRVQFLRGGMKYPVDFDMVPNSTITQNADVLVANGVYEFLSSDPQLAKQFIESIIPEWMTDRTSISPVNLNRDYTMVSTNTAASYKNVINGGAMMGIGMRYSQFNGQDFSSSQWGCSLESTLTSDSPQSVFLFFKSRQTIMFSPQGVQLEM